VYAAPLGRSIERPILPQAEWPVSRPAALIPNAHSPRTPQLNRAMVALLDILAGIVRLRRSCRGITAGGLAFHAVVA
jgi:hypothetical protein